LSEESSTRDLPEISPRRRRLIKWMTGGFLSLWGFGFAWVIAAFLKPLGSREGLAERVIKVGPLDSLPVGKAQLVRRGREPLFVIRTGEDNLVGLAGVCSHLHCVLQWDEQLEQLQCPCHEGSFDVNGNVLKGPAARGLRRYQVETRLGEIYLHLI
jgi:cytochrome b6-f complex iron-sulfur subunit